MMIEVKLKSLGVFICGAALGFGIGVVLTILTFGIAFGQTEAVRDSATQLNPPSTWAMYWYEMETCVGVYDKRFRDVTFYSVPTHGTLSYDCEVFLWWKKRCYGNYRPGRNAILLADELVGWELLVKHEMLHALGVTNHNDTAFWRCAKDDGNMHPRRDYLK